MCPLLSNAEPASIARVMESSGFKERLAKRLSSLRKERGFSQAEVADGIQVREKSVQRYESGKHGIALETVLRLARFYDLTVEELVNGADSRADTVRELGNDFISKVRNSGYGHVADEIQKLLERSVVNGASREAASGRQQPNETPLPAPRSPSWSAASRRTRKRP